MVTSKEKMKELLEASESDLSLHAAAIDVRRPKISQEAKNFPLTQYEDVSSKVYYVSL